MKILVVDDEELFAQTISVYLESRGFEVLSGLTGEEGLKLFKEHRPSIVLLDIILKGDIKDGRKVLEKIREMDSECQIIMITASDQDFCEECLRKGASFYIHKPVSFQLLKQTLDQALENIEKSGKKEEKEQ